MRRRALYLIALTLCCLLSHAQVTDDVIDSETLSSVTVSARRTRYSRRNNPAVELMRKVIANKKQSDLRSKDYFTYTKYEKMTFSLNEVSDKVFEEGEYKRFAFLKDHVERSPQTGKLILPLTVDETLSEVFYRKDPKDRTPLFKVLLNENEATLPLPSKRAPYYRWSDFRKYYLKKLDAYED